MSAADLHLKLSGKKKAVLTFQLRDEADQNDEEDAIYFSNNGGKKFSKAHEIDPQNLPDGEYSEVVIDIVARAKELNLELTDTFVVRFQQSGAKDFAGKNWGDRDGFFIDDLKIEKQCEQQWNSFKLKCTYYNKFKAALRQAFEDGYISRNFATTVKVLAQGETSREHLTHE